MGQISQILNLNVILQQILFKFICMDFYVSRKSFYNFNLLLTTTKTIMHHIFEIVSLLFGLQKFIQTILQTLYIKTSLL